MVLWGRDTRKQKKQTWDRALEKCRCYGTRGMECHPCLGDRQEPVRGPEFLSGRDLDAAVGLRRGLEAFLRAYSV